MTDRRLSTLLEDQDAFEKRLGWHTPDRLEAAEDREDARQEELEFAAYRLDQELEELRWVARQYEMLGKKEDRIRDRFEARVEEWDTFWDPTIARGSWFQRNGFEAPTTEEYRALAGEDVREDLLRDDIEWERYEDRIEDGAGPEEYIETTKEILDEKMGLEAVDAFLFLKKVGETLDDDLATYRDVEADDTYRAIEEVVEDLPGQVDHESTYGRGFGHRREVEALKAGLHTEAATGRYGPDASRENLYDDVFKEAHQRREDGTYDADVDERLGERTASLMEGLLSFVSSLDRPFEAYLADKIERNHARMEAEEDFGVEAGYGEVGDHMVPSYRS
jgi:hypothetical protein